MAQFNAAADAKALHDAMKGLGTNVPGIIAVIAHRNKQQLMEIAAAYGASHKHSLIEDLKGESALNGHFYELAAGLLSSPVQVRINLLKKATKGAGTRERALIDVLVSSYPQEIQAIHQTDPTAIAAVVDDVGGDFRKVVLELLKGTRDWNPNVNDAEAQACAEVLYKAGEGKIGTDEKVFVDIIARKSPQFLFRVSEFYKAAHKGRTIEQAIKSETSGHFEDTLLALLKPRDLFIADRLYSAMKGLGTDDTCLVYFFSILSKPELQEVGRIFTEKRRAAGDKQQTLLQWVEDDTSGNYRDLLRALLS